MRLHRSCKLPLMLGILLTFGGESIARADEARAKSREGVEAYKKQDYESAIRSFRRAADLKPEVLDYQFNLGTALARQDRYDEAEAALRKASEADVKQSPDATYNLAYSIAQSASNAETPLEPQEKLKKLREAIDGFRKAVIADPNDRDAKYNLETSRMMLRELEQQMQEQQQNQEGEKGDSEEGENQEKNDGEGSEQGGDQEQKDQEKQESGDEQQGEDQKSNEGENGKSDEQKESEGQKEGLENEGEPKDQESEQQGEESDKQEDGAKQKEGMDQQKSEQASQQEGGETGEGQPLEGKPTEEQLDALRVLNSLSETKPEQFKKLFQFKGQRQKREKDW